ncbi:MAG: YicC/YloC family endoribonuclease [Lachnospiraceae bacterium]
MIKSMTGFGRCEILENDRKFVVEIKSVNHRYLDVNFKIPKKLGFFESSIRMILKEYIQRGKVDVFITYEDYHESNISVKYNEEIAAVYMKYLSQMAETFHIKNEIDTVKLSHFPEVFTMEEQTSDEKELWSLLEKALREASRQLVESRIREGEHLKQDLFEKLDGMLNCVAFIEVRSPDIIEEYKAKLTEKVKELLFERQLEESRIITEVAIFADKVSVDEEIVRLKSHIAATKKELSEDGSVGRKLDFIAQEMNREANTILSKSSDLELADIGIQLKTDIEKVREQIQNIE